MTELQPIIVFHDRNFGCRLRICNPIYFELLQIMSSVIPCNLKRTSLSQTVSSCPQTRHTHKDTKPHDDSMKRNALRGISPKNIADLSKQE